MPVCVSTYACGLLHDARRNEEQNLLSASCNGCAPEQVADYGQGSQSGHLIFGVGFGIDKDSADDRCTSIGDKNAGAGLACPN